MGPPPDGGTTPPADGGAAPDSGATADGGADAGEVPPGIGVIDGTQGVFQPYAGNSVSIDDTTIVLGDSAPNCYSGTASVYVWDGVSSWQKQQVLDDPDPTGPMGSNLNCFGGATAVNGNTAFVSSTQGNSFAGMVYPYTRSGTTWTAGSTISDPYGGEDEFGYALAFDGTDLVAGAPGVNGNGNGFTYVGRVGLLTKQGMGWSVKQTITPPSQVQGECFGTSVALDGTRIAVGANGGPHDQYELAGAAYSYQLSGGTATFEAGANGSDTQSTDGFGTSVALASGTPALMIVGAPGADRVGSNSGAAYVFYFDSGASEWAQNAEIVPSDGMANAKFGYTVGAISSTEVVIGAPGANEVYLYVYAAGTWGLATIYQSCPVSIGSTMATWDTLLVTGDSNAVVIDTSLTNPACGGN